MYSSCVSQMKSKQCSHNLQPSRVLPANVFTDHVLKNQRSTVLRKIKKGKLKDGQFFLYYILAIHKVIDFMLLFSIWLAFSFKQFSP